MKGHTTVTVVGNVGRIPDLRSLGPSQTVASFSVAVNEVRVNKAGERTEHVNWIDVEAWGKTAELVGQHVTEGAPVVIVGRLRQDRWTDESTGQKRSKLKVVADTFRVFPKREQTEDHEQPPASVTQAKPAPTKPLAKWADEVGQITEDDIPF